MRKRTFEGYLTEVHGRARSLLANAVIRYLSPSRHHWPHHVLYIAGLPKSGTTWMAQLLTAVPGYALRRPYDPDRCVSAHNVCDAVFADMPWSRYSVVKLHTRCTTANLAVVKKYGVRTVVMYRDLRDQCVSRYYHVLYDPTHRHHRYYNSIPLEAGLAHCIEITLEEYMPWIQDWLPFLAQFPDRFHEVRYEELQADPADLLARVLRFYEIDLPHDRIVDIVNRVARRTRFDLRSNLRWGRGTARKGIVGDWRSHFSDSHVRRFKEVCGKFLIELGYERDLDWRV